MIGTLLHKSICSFGDSVMKGIMIDNKNPESEKFKYVISDHAFVQKCEQELDITINNYASFGNTIVQGEKGVERHKDSVVSSDYVVLEFGGNDCDFNWPAIAENPDTVHLCNTPLQLFREKYTDLILKIRSLCVEPVMLSLPMIDSDRYFNNISKGINAGNILKWLGGKTEYIGHWHDMYNLEVFKLARQLNVALIDITTPFLEKTDYRDFICEDGIHPNEQGHALIADAICTHYRNVQLLCE